MTKEKVLELCDFYHAELSRLGAVAEKANENRSGDTVGLCAARNHLAWACEYTKKLANEKLKIAIQWIGFIQGSLWMTGDFTIEELREHGVERPAVPIVDDE